MGAVLGGGNQVDVAFLHQFAFGNPGHGPVHDLALLGQLSGEQFRRQQFAAGQFAQQVIAQAIAVMPFVALAAGFVEQLDGQAGAQHCLGAQQMLERAHVVFGGVEVFWVHPEAQARAGIFLAHAAHDFQLAVGITIAEFHAVFVAVALDEQLDLLRQRIDYADAHAMQAAAEGVVAVAELAAGMQAGQDQFHAGDLLFRVDVHRHAATVVADLATAVFEKDDFDLAGVTGQRLVHRVVDDFLGQVVGARGVGVHARTALDRVQAGKDFNVCCVVAGAHAGQLRKGIGNGNGCHW